MTKLFKSPMDANLRFLHHFELWVLLLSFICVGAADNAGGESRPPIATTHTSQTFSTPDRALTTFVAALHTLDMESLRAASVGSEADYERIHAIFELAGSAVKERDVALGRFGNASAPWIAEMSRFQHMIQRLGHARIKEDKSFATLTNEQGRRVPAKLVKRGDQWKVNIASMETLRQMFQDRSIATAAKEESFDELAADTQTIKARKEAIDQITAEIQAGKIKRVNEIPSAFAVHEAHVLQRIAPSVAAMRDRFICVGNMRMIGQGVYLYANGHRGKYPPNLGELYKAELMAVDVFICPAGGVIVPEAMREGSQGATDENQRSTAAWISANSPYVYLGADKTSASPPDTPLLYEKQSYHGHGGRNVLFNNGKVRFLSDTDTRKLIPELQK